MYKLFTYVIAALLLATPSYALEGVAPLVTVDGSVKDSRVYTCTGTDDTAAITAAIAAAAATDGGGEVLLSGPLCQFSGAILKSNVDVTCMPETVLKALATTIVPMFKPTNVSTYITNWAVRGCRVDMNQKHVSFIDVGELPNAITAAGNSNWAVEDNHIQFATVDTANVSDIHFSYLKLSCDNPIDASFNASDNEGPCRIKGNTIIGSFNRDTTKRCVATTGSAVSNICTQNSGCTGGTCQRTTATKLLTEYNDTGITVTSAPGGLVDSAAAILVDGNTVQAVEGSAIVFGSSTSTTGVETAEGSVQGIVSDNAFSSSYSESAIVRSGIGTNATALAATLSYSQITGNFFATHPLRTISSAATEVQLAGNNNQTVGNTFKVGTTPTIGNGANFVGNYTAGESNETYDNSMHVCTNRGLTGSVEFFGLNAPCNHVSIIGNVGTAKVVVTNPQDLIIANNKYLSNASQSGVKLIRYLDNTVATNKTPYSTRILGNNFSTKGGQGINNGKSLIEFKIHSSDTYGDTAWWNSVVISNNIFGVAPSDGERVDNAFGAVQYCFDGGDDTDLNLSGVSLIGNVYNCHTVGAPNGLGSRFAGTNKLVSSCNNIDNSSDGGGTSYLSCDSETRSIVTTGTQGMRLETFNGPLNLWAGNFDGGNTCSGTAAQIALCSAAGLRSWQGGVEIEAATSVDITATAGDISIGTATAGVHPIAVSSVGNITTALLPTAAGTASRSILGGQDFAQFNAAGPILLTGHNPVLIDSNGHLSRGASEIRVDVTSSVSTSSTTVVLASATNTGTVLTVGQDGEHVTITTQNFLPDDIMILPDTPASTIDMANGHTNCGFCIASGCALTQHSVLNLTYGSPTASKWNITSCSPTTGQGSGGLGGRRAPLWVVQSFNVVSSNTSTLNPAAGIVPFTVSGSSDIVFANTNKGLSNGATDGDIIRLINVGSNKLTWTNYPQAADSTLDLGIFTDSTPVNGRGCQDTSPTATDWLSGSPCNALGCNINPGNALDLMWDGTNSKWVLQACWGP